MKPAPVAAAACALLGLALAGCSQPYVEVPVAQGSARTIVNPYGIAPLSCVVVIPASVGPLERTVHRVDVALTDADGHVDTWSLPYGSPNFAADFDTSDLPGIAGEDIVVPVLGVLPDAQTAVTVSVFDDYARRKYVYRTTVAPRVATDAQDPLRGGYPTITASSPRPSGMERGMTLVSFSMGNNGSFMTRPFIMDSRGRMRWLLKLDDLKNWASPVERLKNGNLVFGRGAYVYEYSMLGRQVHAWDIGRFGYTQHHDVIEIDRGAHAGDLFVAVDRIDGDTVEDVVIEIDRSGRLVETWDLRKLLEESRGTLLRNPKDWLHMNAVSYDPRDDSLVISGRNQGVAKVGRDRVLRWILAPHEGWGQRTSPYLLTAVSASGTAYPEPVQRGLQAVAGGREFDWPWGQHAVGLLRNGDIFMFDNGFNRHFEGKGEGASRAVEYRIDERRKTVRQVWQYGADRGADFFSDIISDVDVLPRTNNRLVTSGSIRHSADGPHAYVTEITYPGAEKVFEARIAFHDAYSNLKAGGWGNMDIVYRAERMRLYPGVSRGR